MSINLQEDGRYRVRVNHKGKEIVRTRDTHFEAVNLENDLKQGLLPQNACTLGDALQIAWETRWKNHNDGLKGSYARGRLCCEFFGYDTALSSIKPTDLSRYKDYLGTLGLSPSTKNRRVSAFNVMWKCAGYEGLVAQGDRPIVQSERENEGRLRWLFPNEEKAIYEYWASSSGAIADALIEWMKVSLDTGMRTRESLVVGARDKKLADLTVESKVELGEDEEDEDFFTKNARSRVIPLSPRANMILSRRHNMSPFFADLNYGIVKYHFNKARKYLFNGEKEITPYVTRHTCASRLVQGGMELPKIKKWMGHSSVKVTERYAKMSSRDIKEGVNILSGFTDDI